MKFEHYKFAGSSGGSTELKMPRYRRAKEYRTRAQHCIDIAEGMDLPMRVSLLEMAQAWMRLAQQVERNQKNDLVYETRPRSNGT